MAFKDTYGITQIMIDELRSLRINCDDHGDGVISVILYTLFDEEGNIKDRDHIELTEESVQVLHDWCQQFLLMTPEQRQEKFDNDCTKPNR